ncbi:PREDICTED: zinc finger BED domain-containing protein DAYSLEEPER-like [Brassica oleracea var. oleracea]|uniref:BED-type domain-containing protein n=1 Tax=Brassica oleracea var. oleracea TaxID=109376 RepID=A0A0D3CPH4_BRAOL|nr:PREDICTED: zinc finger BED domain-containing protein DAYSLEEPER-like [Brassica oleracea var. oleracea]XP_013592468.1 PREDICTED: zinc finger BED domain-containing protein DAYSLEEPER-like [Brassica oleracea var. oleracea]
METALEVYNDVDKRSPETQPIKRRKKQSKVWEHFTIQFTQPGCRRAFCIGCNQSFAYSNGSKVAGTSHLKRHIDKGTCPALVHHHNTQDNNEMMTPHTAKSETPYTDKSETPRRRRYRTHDTSACVVFDQDKCRHEIAKMITMHDYPLHMVEHPGFVSFVHTLQPNFFDALSFNNVQGDCVATYLAEKQNVIRSLEGIPGRFCLTLDFWTSKLTLGYVFITCHFIDNDWKIQKKLLNVLMEPCPESEQALSLAVANCVSEWGLEGKLFSVTFNHPASKPAAENIRPLLCIKNPRILNGQMVIGNCVARTFSGLAKDVLDKGKDVIKKVRDCVKHVKTSESHEERFVALMEQLQLPGEKVLSLDDQTQWDTTYKMLVAASELKEVFSCLDTADPDFKQPPPSTEDWSHVETLCTLLKPLLEAASTLQTTGSPSAVTFFHEVWKTHSDLSRSIAGDDPYVAGIVKTMKEKADKYWRECSLVLAMAVVMDPRFKMKLVEFSFSKIFGEDAGKNINTVDDGIHELFSEYVALSAPVKAASEDELSEFDKYIIKERAGKNLKSEMDQYLEETLLPRVQEFDVLEWWKQNKLKFPTLSKMARDILAIPVSAAAFDYVFDVEPREMDEYKTSLRPETVEALICAREWLRESDASSGADVQMSSAIVKAET